MKGGMPSTHHSHPRLPQSVSTMVVSRVVGVVLGLVCVVAGVVLAVVMLVLFSNNNNNKETGEGGIMSGREKQEVLGRQGILQGSQGGGRGSWGGGGRLQLSPDTKV
ncbi:hypothetical protein Pmani_015293 [Petrolisthes manimaculis]|uniref:Uncharacterized protein n=1 Tax=Petrolisthes manimaculis TaxID=1843537 RepID=A0AAE1UC63_9EUCA|nr:hypothetical protein Pmani_015293 [Petrolisthes manimaculis]